MAFKLLEAVQRTWRRFDTRNLLPLVRAGVAFKDGQLENDRSTEQRRPLEGAA